MGLLSPFRPILRNGNPFLEFLGNAFTAERILQRPTPTSSVGNQPAENLLTNLSTTAVVLARFEIAVAVLKGALYFSFKRLVFFVPHAISALY